MKHIKLFENFDILDLVDDVKDILVDLYDLGYSIDVFLSRNKASDKEKKILVVYIQGIEGEGSKSGDRFYDYFKADIYKDYDLRIKEYLGDKLKKVEYDAYLYSYIEDAFHKKEYDFNELLDLDSSVEELICNYEIK